MSVANPLVNICRVCKLEYYRSRSDYAYYCSKKCKNERTENANSIITRNPKKNESKKMGDRLINYYNRTMGSLKSTRIKERDHYLCYICGSSCNLEAHHIIPKIEGGSHREENLITLCKSCHMVVETGNVNRSMKICTRNASKEVLRRFDD